jgi:hypothetical protein
MQFGPWRDRQVALQINLVFCKAKNYCGLGEIVYAFGFTALNIGLQAVAKRGRILPPRSRATSSARRIVGQPAPKLFGND